MNNWNRLEPERMRKAQDLYDSQVYEPNEANELDERLELLDEPDDGDTVAAIVETDCILATPGAYLGWVSRSLAKGVVEQFNGHKAAIQDLKDQLSEANDQIQALKDKIDAMHDHMEEEIARAKDCGFEAGKRGGWY